MEISGIVLPALSLVSIIYTDFSRRKILNLSLVGLIIGLTLRFYPLSLSSGLFKVIAVGVVLTLINTYLTVKKKSRIEPGDVKLILILSFFFNLQILSLILIGSSAIGLIYAFIYKQKKIPLGGILSLVILIYLTITAITS